MNSGVSYHEGVTAAEAAIVLKPLLDDNHSARFFADPTAWTLMKQASRMHGMANLLAAAGRLHSPPEERGWCDATLASGWSRHNRNLMHLEEAVTRLAKIGIQPMALKGPLLAQRYYAPPFLRKPSVDLDIAVRACEVGRACETFLDEGYTIDGSLAETLDVDHHLTLLHPEKPRLELHFRLSHRSLGLEVEEFLKRAQPHRLPGGGAMLIPAPADEIFHLMLHVVQDRFAMLFHLYELRLVCRKLGPEAVREAIGIAVKRRFAGAVAITDVAFRTHLGEPFIPEGTELPLTWRHREITPQLLARMESGTVGGTAALTLGRRLAARWIEFQLTDRPSDALRFATSFLKTAGHGLRNRRWGAVKVMRYASADGRASAKP